MQTEKGDQNVQPEKGDQQQGDVQATKKREREREIRSDGGESIHER